jgi:hypothetical protein
MKYRSHEDMQSRLDVQLADVLGRVRCAYFGRVSEGHVLLSTHEIEHRFLSVVDYMIG